MWLVERFAVPGPPTGADNMWRCFPWLKPSRRPSLLLVHLVPSVRIIAGVAHAMRNEIWLSSNLA
jgi:hypothetical protein